MRVTQVVNFLFQDPKTEAMKGGELDLFSDITMDMLCNARAHLFGCFIGKREAKDRCGGHLVVREEVDASLDKNGRFATTGPC